MRYSSNTIPTHLAVIMDGNGRWALKRFLPRIAGYKKALDTTRLIIELCAKKSIHYLTLFAFSSENWRRPVQEITFLMDLFLQVLTHEVQELHQKNIRLKIIGNLHPLSAEIKEAIYQAEILTHSNTGLALNIAINYGGQWEIVEATKIICNKIQAGELTIDDITPTVFETALQCKDTPPPDLLIRTSGEQRLSNFLLWQLAYTELYFTDTLWPDFTEKDFLNALYFYASRERRFGASKSINNTAVNNSKNISFLNSQGVLQHA